MENILSTGGSGNETSKKVTGHIQARLGGEGNIWPVACLCMISKLRMVFYILQCCKEKYAIKTM